MLKAKQKASQATISRVAICWLAFLALTIMSQCAIFAAAPSIWQQATDSYLQGNYQQSERLFLLCLKEAEQNGNKADQVVALSNLAKVEAQLGKLEASEGYIQQSLPLIKEREGPGSLSLSESLNTLAALKQKCGQVNEAILLLKQSIEVDNTGGRGTSQNTATTYCNLGVCLYISKRNLEAEKYFAKAISIDQALPKTVASATHLAEYAKLLRATGRAKQASALDAQADSIRAANKGLVN